MTFPLMDRTRRLTEEALGEAELDLAAARRRAPGRRLDADADGPVLRLADGRQAAAGRRERRRGRRAGRGDPGGDRGGPDDRRRHAAVHALGAGSPRQPAAAAPPRRVTDVMSHSLGTIAVSPDGSAYVNDIVIRRNLPIPAEQHQVVPPRDPRRRQHPARGLPDPGRERRAARLHDPRQVRLQRASRRPTPR